MKYRVVAEIIGGDVKELDEFKDFNSAFNYIEELAHVHDERCDEVDLQNDSLYVKEFDSNKEAVYKIERV